MKQLFATLVLGLAVAVSSWGQCGSMAYNPVTRQMDCIGTPGVGTGDVLGAAALTHAGAIAKVASAATLTEATAGTDYLAPVATNPQTGATYAILTGDRGKLVTIAYATAQATSIAQAGSTGFPDGWEVTVLNSGAGTATITPLRARLRVRPRSC